MKRGQTGFFGNVALLLHSSYLNASYFILFQNFAASGLRTLVLGYKDLTAAEFQSWKASHDEVGCAWLPYANAARFSNRPN